MPTPTILHGDCIEVMRGMADNSVDAIVTDPPYGLGFMGKAWDDLPPGLDFAVEALRVLRPGGHMLAFGGTRTWHRLAVAIEDAGFEIRDSIAWLYGSGFPKSMDVSKAIDKAAGATREVAATDAAREWQGWGTALKPAFEPVVVARKPLVGTVAANVLAHGTGALNIDASRVGTDRLPAQTAGQARIGTFERGAMVTPERVGRFPANVILDESQAAVLDEQSGTSRSPRTGTAQTATRAQDGRGRRDGYRMGDAGEKVGHGDAGGASRFFYVAKAPKRERPVVDGVAHPTVKPLALMRYLVRLVTPTGGTVLEPFAGSGATVEAALLEGFDVVAIEREADYLPLIQARIERTPRPSPHSG